MIQYLYDFLTILFDKIEDKNKIRNIILFGSFARNEQRKNSDVDLFIDVSSPNKEEIEGVIKESLNEFEIKVKSKWGLKGIANAIIPIVDDINNDRWSELKSEISAYGIILYGKYKSDSKAAKHSVLIEYDLSKIKQNNKMKVLRKLYGYKLKVGKKIYLRRGLVDELRGDKISNALILNISDYNQVYSFLKQNKIPVKIRRAWLE